MTCLHPLDAGLLEIHAAPSGLAFPPPGWRVVKEWGLGYALQRGNLYAIIDCERKDDDRWWVHVSVSKKNRMPSQEEMCLVKLDFFGDRYAYAVYPPSAKYVNKHKFCLHLWALADDKDGRVLPEFSAVVPEWGGRNI